MDGEVLLENTGQDSPRRPLEGHNGAAKVVLVDPFTDLPYVAGSGGGGGGGATTIADGYDVTQGAKADAASTWYNVAGSIVSKIGLLIAAIVGAGSHVYGYDASGNMTTDDWTLFSVTRRKTYAWNASGQMTAESDWV